jgi:myo-inositol-1-phosphate synthase
MTSSVLVAIAGLGGAVGSTFAAGVSLPPGESSCLGLATESPLVKALDCEMPSLDSFIVDGWDLHTESLFYLCLKHGICPNTALMHGKNKLTKLKPRPGIDQAVVSVGKWIRKEARYLRRRKERECIDHVIIVNLCPTEPWGVQCAAASTDWGDLDALTFAALPAVSALYFRLAIEARAHFINFTPNLAEPAALRVLAERAGIVYAGRDGKTGQTFLKTIVAPAFRDKNLYIDGWFSTNLLGNDDGLSLACPEAGKAKIASKSKCLSSILGYTPGGDDAASHQVHIHYYPPRGDSKEAWDNIDFRGFLGVRMQMKINWLGQDSILAAPAVIDLVRLVIVAANRGEKGPLEAASYFFKDPVVGAQSIVQHAVPQQFAMLLAFLRRRDN